ncbi:unnamed protein product [Rodentolepis nana]|uniref:EGF-like domain-containing protein n=1 Tax=Rodentolepis nana TaxID=102285 RepID=A0A0R3T3V5_RODNA|nr:unnamed protein product [Rodentolepis nana]
MKDPRFTRFRYGFPAGIYASSIIPTTIWFHHWDVHPDGTLRVLNFGTLLPISINWFHIVSSCDEIHFPRCSWAHFVNFVQPLQFDYDLLEASGATPGISQEDMVPYMADGCWPIKSVEQASLIYIYVACTAYWNTPGFDRQLCPTGSSSDLQITMPPPPERKLSQINGTLDNDQLASIAWPYSDSPSSCHPCASGFYAETLGQSFCLPCPHYHYTPIYESKVGSGGEWIDLACPRVGRDAIILQDFFMEAYVPLGSERNLFLLKGFYWDSNAFSCVSENRCEKLCHHNNTATCLHDPKTLSLTCVCRLGYMGHDCSDLLDACLIGSQEYDPADDFSSKPILPAGKEACGSTNKCIPRLGTTTYICQCSEGFKMDRNLPYDNCAAKKDPCSNKICVEGWCISSQDRKQSICECEDGFGGEQCDEQLGGWTTWSSWSSCEPFCGDQRLRRRIRVCASEREEDCMGPLEQVESCPDAEPCPAALSMEDLEWQDFAEWFCLLLIISLAYILALFCLLTIIAVIIPSTISMDSIVKKSLEERFATPRVPLKRPECVHHCGDH